MRSPGGRRFTLAGLLGLIALVAFGLAALRDGSDFASRACATIMLAVLIAGVLGAIVSGKDPGWLGFALFGWGYALSAWFLPDELVTQPILEGVVAWMQRLPSLPGSLPFEEMTGRNGIDGKWADGAWEPLSLAEHSMKKFHDDDVYYYKNSRNGRSYNNALRAGHSLLALLAAWLGAGLGRSLAGRSSAHRARSEGIAAEGPHPPSPLVGEGRDGGSAIGARTLGHDGTGFTPRPGPPPQGGREE